MFTHLHGLARIATIACITLVLGPAAVRAQEPRTWEDSTGKFQVQATFVSVENGKVVLQKADGTTLDVETKRLSPADQKYVEEQQKAAADNPFQARPKPADDPFKPAPGQTSPMTPAATPSAGAAPRVIEPDWSDARVVALVPADTTWKLDPPGAPPAAASTAKPRPIGLPPKVDFFEGVRGLVVNASGTRAVVGYGMDEPRPQGQTRLVLCDLEAGKMLGAARTSGLMAPLALSADGLEALVRSDTFGFGNQNRLELWRLTPSGITKVWTCTPYGDSTGADADIKWACFLPDARFATISAKGKLAIWDQNDVKPLFHADANGGCIPGLSADGKRLAFATAKELAVLDVTAGEVVAMQPLPAPFMPWPQLSFSPSGNRLACVSNGKLYAWDVATGSLHREILLDRLPFQPGSPIAWTDDAHVILAKGYLIDVDNQVKLWDYRGAEAAAASAGDLCWFLLTPINAANALVPARVPPNGADDLLKRALADPNFFVVKQGSAVTIDPSGIAEPSQRDRVVKGLTARLAAIGVTVVPDSHVVLQASTEAGKEEEITYRHMGAGFRTDTFKVRGQISRVKFLYDGAPIWESSTNTIPHFEFTNLKPNESLQDHVRAFEKPNYDYFDRIDLPRLLSRPMPPGQLTLGQSEVTATGVR
jgi:hypothetical protein